MRPLALALTWALVCAPPALAQAPVDEPVDGPIGEPADGPSRLEVCPELATAGPREKKQLTVLFFDLGPERLKAEAAAAVRELFDLETPADEALLVRYLDAPGPIRCGLGLRAVFRAHGAKGLLWLLERMVGAPPARRGRLIGMLAGFDTAETWALLLHWLEDTTPVPDEVAAKTAPPGYTHLRVCDHALRALSSKLSRLRRIKVKRGNRHVNPTLPIETRDHRIQEVRALLADHEDFEAHLTGLPRLVDDLDRDEATRAKAALRALGVEAS